MEIVFNNRQTEYLIFKRNCILKTPSSEKDNILFKNISNLINKN